MFWALHAPQFSMADVTVKVLERVLLVLAGAVIVAKMATVAVGPVGAHIRTARHGCSGERWDVRLVLPCVEQTRHEGAQNETK